MFRVPSAAEVHALVRGLVLPEKLLVGTSNAGYQNEGGFNAGDGPRNNWAEWESLPGKERTGPSARFWDLPERDLELAKAMSLNAHRMSVEWARVQPVRSREKLSAPPPWDEGAVARYVEILAASRARGLEPLVTLHHFTHPYWLGLDFWLTDEAPERFALYAGELVRRVNEGLLGRGEAPVRYWLTLNEPNALAPGTYLARWMPSGHDLDLGAPGRMGRAIDALYAGHVLAYGAVHRWYEQHRQPPPMVSFNNFGLDFYEADRMVVDVMLARSRGLGWGDGLRDDLAGRARRWHQLLAPLDETARLTAPERWLVARGVRQFVPRLLTPERFPKLRAALEASDYLKPLDYVAFDYYDPTVANQVQLAAGSYEPWEWEAVPEGLALMAKANSDGGLPVVVAENGMATRKPLGGRAEPRADGVRRDEFLRAHLFHLLAAMKDGVDVLGYFHWSLTDNYEWGRFSPRFGLHAVDYLDEEKRRDGLDAAGVDAAGAYAAVARALAARDPKALESALVG